MFVFLIILAISINYLSELDPDELRERTIPRRITGTITKTFPMTVKLLHYTKLTLYLIILIVYVPNPAPGTEYLNTNPILRNDLLYCNNSSYTNIVINNYKGNIGIFTYLEGTIIYFILCILGGIKGLIYEEAFIYQPVSRESGAMTVCFCHFLGP